MRRLFNFLKRWFQRPAAGPRAWAIACLAAFLVAPAAVLTRDALRGGWENFWNALTLPPALAAMKFSLGIALLVATVNAVMGALSAWVLERRPFPGRGLLNALVDWPLAVPTLATGAALASLSWLSGGDGAFGSTAAMAVALLFVTLPMAVRPVQTSILSADRALKKVSFPPSATAGEVFRKGFLPRLLPGVAAGFCLCFSRALGEMGAVVMVAGNLPMKTQTVAVYALGEIESDNRLGAGAVSVVMLAASFLLSFCVEWARDRFSERPQ